MRSTSEDFRSFGIPHKLLASAVSLLSALKSQLCLYNQARRSRHNAPGVCDAGSVVRMAYIKLKTLDVLRNGVSKVTRGHAHALHIVRCLCEL